MKFVATWKEGGKYRALIMEISTLIKTAVKVIILYAVSPGFTFLIMKIVYTRMSSASVFIEAK